MTPSNFLEAGVAIYVALAVALSVWVGIFIYLWRIDAMARELKRQIERDRAQAESGQRPAAPRATVTRVSAAERETVEQ